MLEHTAGSAHEMVRMCKGHKDCYDKAWDLIAKENPVDSCPYQQWLDRPAAIIVEDSEKNASSSFNLLLDLEGIKSTNAEITEHEVALGYSMIFKRTGLRYRTEFARTKTDVYMKNFFDKAKNRRSLLEEWKRKWPDLEHAKSVKIKSNGSDSEKPNKDNRSSERKSTSTKEQLPVRKQISYNAISTIKKTPNCVYCSKDHYLHSCTKFKRQEAAVKEQLIKEEKLCLICLRVATKNHSCANIQCQTCGDNTYCSTTHGLKINDTAITTNLMITTEEACSSPVIRLVEKYDDVLILLDTGEDKTFVSKSAATRWGLTGPEQLLQVKTISDVKSVWSSKVSVSFGGYTIQAYTMSNLHVVTRSILTSAQYKKWPHLSGR